MISGHRHMNFAHLQSNETCWLRMWKSKPKHMKIPWNIQTQLSNGHSGATMPQMVPPKPRELCFHYNVGTFGMTCVSPIRPNWNGAKRRKLLVAVGQMAQMTKHIDPGAATTPAEQPPPEEEHHDIIFDTFPIWSDRDPTIQLGGAGKPVFDRLRNLVSDVEAVPQWVSSYQFLVHFQQYTGTVGPTRTVHMGTTARPHCWIQVLSEGNLEIAPVRRRPAGAAIAIWIRCYWMRISPVMVSGIDVLFLSHVGRPITKVGRQLEGIPLPTRQGWCS